MRRIRHDRKLLLQKHMSELSQAQMRRGDSIEPLAIKTLTSLMSVRSVFASSMRENYHAGADVSNSFDVVSQVA